MQKKENMAKIPVLHSGTYGHVVWHCGRVHRRINIYICNKTKELEKCCNEIDNVNIKTKVNQIIEKVTPQRCIPNKSLIKTKH